MSTAPIPAGPAHAGSPTVTELVSGILADAQTLFKQQVDMVRVEFKEDLRKSKDVAKFLGLGAGLLTVGGLFLTVAVVFLLHHLAPTLPLWACWAIVGGLLTAAGGAALFAGYRIMATYNPLPDKSLNALQENLQWTPSPQS